MKKRSEAGARNKIPEREIQLEVPHDAINEMAVLAAMLVDVDVAKRLLPVCPTDAFYAEEHATIRDAIGEAVRKGLPLDPGVLARLNPEVDSVRVEKLVAARPEVPDRLDYYVETLLWDRQLAQAVRGPVSAFLESAKNPKHDRDDVRILARRIGEAFDGEGGKHLLVGKDVVRQAVAEVARRVDGIAIHPFGIDGLDKYESGEWRMVPGVDPGGFTLVTALSGSGKALAVDTPIATPKGWSTMGELRPGDEVFDEKGEPCDVVACTPVMNDRECYELEFSDGAKIVADAAHLWKTISFRERYMTTMQTDRWRIQSNERRRLLKGSVKRRAKVSKSLLEHYATRREYVPVDGSLRTTKQIAETIMNGKHRNHAVPVTEPLVLSPGVLPIDPYMLGVWLGDGCSSNATITSADPEILKHFSDAGYVVVKKKGYKWSVKARNHYSYHDGYSESFRAALRKNGLLGNKHIPPEYLRGDIDQRLALLQGLMDTDGTISKTGALSFDNTNPRLVEGFEELLASLGIKGKPHARAAKLNGRVVGTSWRFSFCTDLPVFRLKRKLARVVPSQRGVHKRRYIVGAKRVASVPVRCIQVDSPSAMYLAGREMIPTHNSLLLGHLAIASARKRRKVLFGAWEDDAPTTIEHLTTLALKWSRTAIQRGLSSVLRTADGSRAKLTPEEIVRFEETAHKIAAWVTFFKNPFRHGERLPTGRNATNDDHLDIIENEIAKTACDVFIADLLQRALVDDTPSGERMALYRMRHISQTARMHTMAAHQQRAKDIEKSNSKKPTREGIIGTGAWLDVPRTIIAPHLPAKWKNVPDDKMELFILKQSKGEWPCGVEFDYDPATGQISDGRSFDVRANNDSSDGATAFDLGGEAPAKREKSRAKKPFGARRR